MTVSSETKRNDYNGNDITVEFAVGFYFLINADVRAILYNTVTKVETVLTEVTHYTLTGAGNPAGGTLTMITAPTSDETLTFLRYVSETQETDYVDYSKFPAESHERALDKLTMLFQQKSEESDRTIRFKQSSAEVDVELEDLVANKVIIVNSTGDELEMGPSGNEISSAQTYAEAAQTAQTAAETAQTAAETAQTAAELAETNAVTAKTAAELAETHAETAETNAVTAKTAAELAETNAVTAKTAAETAQTAAETAKTAAELAETNAAASAAAASASESAAVASAAAASASESAAAASESAAAASAAEAAASAASINLGTVLPVHYERITRPARTTVDTITIYAGTIINVNETIFTVASNVVLDLNVNANWDTGTALNDAARAGNDYYVYACDNSGTLALLVSANSTNPTGYTTTTSRKIGGFHCLCIAVGTIAGHTLTTFTQGDILPQSVWDLNHRPISNSEGMVYSGFDEFVDIYLPSVSAGELVSINGGTIADGTSAEAFHAYKFDQWFARIGKKPIASLEFVLASLGANQSTNITGSADPVTTGGHVDTASRRMISNIGCEDMCGALLQWGREQGATNDVGAAWANAYDGNDAGVGGQHYEAPNRPGFGGLWNDGVVCGSRGSYWSDSPLVLGAHCSSRGASKLRHK